MNIGTTLMRNANRIPDKLAFKFGPKTYTYKEMNEYVNRLANGLLARGIDKGDKIGIMMKNSDLFVMAFYAIMKAGAVAVPINFRLTEREVEYILKDSDSVALFFDVDYADIIQKATENNDKLRLLIAKDHVLENQLTFEEVYSSNKDEPDVVVSERDDAEILYTSGTTGNPKGALFDHLRVLQVGMNVAITFQLNAEDNLLHLAPLFHSAQLNLFLISGTYVGATQVIHEEFNPIKVLETIEKEKITFFFGIPTMYNFLLQVPNKEDYDLSSIKRYGYGAAPMPTSLIEQTIKLFNNKQIYNLCGLTEAGPGGILLHPEDHEQYAGAGGRPILGTEVKVVDDDGNPIKPGEVGELLIRSDMVMKEYYKKPKETAETLRDGWLYTGDLATVNEVGIYTLVDRKKDMIITGGENVYSTEVEHILYRYPDVLEAAVIGVPDPTWGERVAAVVVPKEGRNIDYEDLRAFCREHLAGYKTPTIFFEEKLLPRNASGKVLKYKLREQALKMEPVLKHV
ncbi:MAG: long-chain fatty acid--CoA ligase [Bacilli bacterium]|nr:long-chain fatty acid--CoA ligase [Bacilli bacterium]